MKKLLAILLACVMLISLTACSGSNDASAQTQTPKTDAPASDSEAAPSNTPEVKPFKYGFICWGTADEHGRTLNAAVQWAVEAAGGEFIMDGSAISAESTVAAAENLISAGCDMISFCTYAGESTVATISDLCQANQVYWTMWDTTISDAEIQAYIDNDPYYVGCTSEDNVTAGYNTMKSLGEAGATNVIIIRYGSNIPTCDDRCTGALNYIQEAGGITVVEDMIIQSGDDYKNAISNVLLAHPEVDSVLLAGSGTYSSSVAEAFKEKGKDTFYIGAFDYFDSMGDMLKSGELTVINGGHMVTGTFSALLAINSYFGSPLSAQKAHITIPYLVLDSYEDYEAYIQYASQGAAYTSEELQQFLVAYNPDLTLDSFQEGVSKWSVDDIMSRKNG
ncbi:MAG: substrate-binding domain-containing protein [Candidatus Faecousia sp.]|nr:substrate-binding domain-containing protein [Candidatus Faecousia sp.]